MSLEALLTSAAFAPLHEVGWLRVTGEDRLRWLNGMTTNNIAALTPGEGCYTFFLNAQGRILADATAFLLENSILLETASPGSLATMLDHFIIMDDVELEVLSPNTLKGLLIMGPTAASALRHTMPADPLTLTREIVMGRELTLIQAHSPLVPIYEMWSDAVVLDNFVPPIRQATPADLEALRILSGTPLYGTDIRNSETRKDLPQETAQTRALHFSKGCYLGQEIVERIHSRGAVHRTFTGFLLTPETSVGIPDLDGMIVNSGSAAPPVPGTPLFATESPDKPIGELTSIAATPLGLFALGYIRRDALDQHKSVQYPGGTAIPSALPFPIDTTKRA